MTFEEAKKELKSYKDTKHSASILRTRINVLKNSGYGFKFVGTAKGRSFETVKGNSTLPPIEKIATKLNELQAELEQTELYAEQRANEISLKISKLEYPYSKLLYYVYIDNFRQFNICDRLHISRAEFFRKKNEAIFKYSKAS